MKKWILAAALAMCAQPTLAAPGKAPPPTPEPSRWAQVPTDADFNRLLPPETVKAPVAGRALMRCKAQDDGSLKDCALIADSAGGAGYGRALLALAGQFRLKADALATLPADRTIIVPYKHLLADKAPDWLRKPTA